MEVAWRQLSSVPPPLTLGTAKISIQFVVESNRTEYSEARQPDQLRTDFWKGQQQMDFSSY
jgi:hypothetical protein